jgi:ferredoxin
MNQAIVNCLVLFMQETPCVFCGNCVSVCPVGALSEKAGRFEGRDWELKKTPTICSYCGVGCTLVLNTKENRIIKVTSDRMLGTNKGWTCVKGRFGFQFVHSPERLTKPLIRANGEFREASWDEAISLVGRATPATWTVLEISSFQLETIQTFRPRIAAVLNVTPDHLDRHGSFERYLAAKARIFENQQADDFAVLNADADRRILDDNWFDNRWNASNRFLFVRNSLHDERCLRQPPSIFPVSESGPANTAYRL